MPSGWTSDVRYATPVIVVIRFLVLRVTVLLRLCEAWFTPISLRSHRTFFLLCF
jgi:hypothetical protein